MLRTIFLAIVLCASIVRADAADIIGGGFFSAPAAPAPTGITVFNIGKLGGGGFNTDITISPDGLTKTTTTDVYGSYQYNNATGKWDQQVTAAHFSYLIAGNGAESYSVGASVFAPSSPSTMYMTGPGYPGAGSPISKSTDGGASWSTVGGGFLFSVDNSNSARVQGPKMAVDPNNPDIVYFGDQAGVIFASFDGGATIANVSALNAGLISATTNAITPAGNTTLHFASTPAAMNPITCVSGGCAIYVTDLTNRSALGIVPHTAGGGTATTVDIGLGGANAQVENGDTILFGQAPVILFDPNSGTTNTCPSPATICTKGIYIGWGYGSGGMYKSTDGGVSWSQLAGGPSVGIERAAFDNAGIMYVIEQSQSATGSWRYVTPTTTNGCGLTTGWTNLAINAGNSWHGVAPDPTTPGRVVFGGLAGNITRSDDCAQNFYGYYANAAIRSCTTIPWHASGRTMEDYMGAGNIAYDPLVPNKLWFVEGIGIWTTFPMTNGNQPTWTCETPNVETLIMMDTVWPSGGHPYMTAMDRAGFLLSDFTQYPTRQGPLDGTNVNLVQGCSTTAAIATPSKIWQTLGPGAGLWVSTDGGVNWSALPELPSAGQCGAIAAQTANNIVWFPGSGNPAYSNDGGATFTDSLFAGSTLNCCWINASYILNRHIVAADFVNNTTYYAFNYAGEPSGGMWKSTDGGANWTRTYTATQLDTLYGSLVAHVGSADTVLRTVPGFAGHIFLALGAQGLPASFGSYGEPLIQSCDGGSSWRKVPDTYEIHQVAIGKEKPGASYPAVFIIGRRTNVDDVSIYRADDFTTDCTGTPTWIKLTDSTNAPAGSLDYLKTMAASPDTYGSLVIGTGASGYIYGALH